MNYDFQVYCNSEKINFSHNPSRYKWLARGIAATFPGEKPETYYQEVVAGQCSASGLLYNKLDKLRREAVRRGTIKAPRGRKTQEKIAGIFRAVLLIGFPLMQEFL